MLTHPIHHNTPFPFFQVAPAFSAEQCAILEQAFLHDGEWQQHDGAFYRCALRDVTEMIPPTFQAELIQRMRAITGLPLVDRCVVTAQRMMPGHVIGVHSDRPLLGYEIARLVVQLSTRWQPNHGGVLELFATPQGKAIVRVPPKHNEAFGFLLHVDSHHGVTEVTQPRQSVVFNFWHEANTPELASYVKALFSNCHFCELPAALNATATAAEESLPEDATLLASTAALALHRWGYDEATVVAGYTYSAGLPGWKTNDDEAHAAIQLANWIAHLHRDDFDLARWERLRTSLSGMAVFARLMPQWDLCLPNSSFL